MGYHFQKGIDPKKRTFYWATNAPAPEPSPFRTDTVATREGSVAVSTISYDPNDNEALASLAQQLAPTATSTEKTT